MAKDPAFLFYPGDYLKDTQCLSEPVQVAYDRIMCEHMRNISLDMNNIAVSKSRVNFFTKKLNDDQREELHHVLKTVDKGFQIEWVAESICKRKGYSISRAKNRAKKEETYVEDMNNTEEHMENANEIISNNTSKVKIDKNGKSKNHQQFRSATSQGADLYAERIKKNEQDKADRDREENTSGKVD